MLAETDMGLQALEAIGGQPMSVPAHFDAEVHRGLRGLARRGFLSKPRLEAAVRLLAEFIAERVPLQPLLMPAHRLGDRISAPDSFYVALTQAYDCEFITCDARLARATADVIRVRLISSPSPAP